MQRTSVYPKKTLLFWLLRLLLLTLHHCQSIWFRATSLYFSRKVLACLAHCQLPGSITGQQPISFTRPVFEICSMGRQHQPSPEAKHRSFLALRGAGLQFDQRNCTTAGSCLCYFQTEMATILVQNAEDKSHIGSQMGGNRPCMSGLHSWEHINWC